MAENQINKSVLDELNDHHIFSLEFKEGKFVLWESCDHYFFHELSPEKFDKLILEIQEFRKLAP